jgi:hypothetical protein
VLLWQLHPVADWDRPVRPLLSANTWPAPTNRPAASTAATAIRV